MDKFLETNLVQELILRGDMAAAQHNPVRPLDQFRGLSGVPTVQHHNFFRVDTGLVDALAHALEDGIGEASVIRGGAHQQHAGLVALRASGPPDGLGQVRLDIGQETVILRTLRFSIAGWAACEVQNHMRKDTNFPAFFTRPGG